MKLFPNRIVVKVGTSTLTNERGKSDLRSFDKLACVLADVQNMGYEVILVSSGAIAVGANKLNMPSRPTEMRFKQAAAAVGQCSNMFLYDKFFSDYDKTIGQILLNAEDIEQEEKRENLTNTFNAMLEMGVIPIVNENDSVLCRASLLIILSDIDGLYDNDPRLHPDAKLISRIETIDESVYKLAGGAGSRRGTGGMRTKLQAAELATAQGTNVVITNGQRPADIYQLLEGGQVGTLFVGR